MVVDDGGNRQPFAAGAAPGGAAADDAVDWEVLLAAAEPISPELNEAGELLPPKLPPVTQLVRLAEIARKYAIYHADLRCVAHEAEILPRLYKALNRLTSYYQQQIEEIYDTHDPKGNPSAHPGNRFAAQGCRGDRESPAACAGGAGRLRRAGGAVGGRRDRIERRRAHGNGARRTDRFDGSLRGPHCHACGRAIVAVALDRNGHLTCDECIRQCAACQAIVCAACGVNPCPVCGKENCDECGRSCWACGAHTCANHLAACPVCGDAVCLACQGECAVCGTRQCRSHLRADHVPAADGSVSLICNSSALRCPGCRQYTARFGHCTPAASASASTA